MTKKQYTEPLTQVLTLETTGVLAASVGTLSFDEDGGSTTLQEGTLGAEIPGLSPLFSLFD